MASKLLSQNDYTIGWICASPKELTAAAAMLDEKHDPLPVSLNDKNSYILGAVGKHNVVVSCVPEEKIGTNSAANVATQMVNIFPSIKFGLMVGIGGGIPSGVRLGDSVVRKLVGEYPGVVDPDPYRTQTRPTYVSIFESLRLDEESDGILTSDSPGTWEKEFKQRLLSDIQRPQSDERKLFIQGKGGTGKSTIIKSLYKNVQSPYCNFVYIDPEIRSSALDEIMVIERALRSQPNLLAGVVSRSNDLTTSIKSKRTEDFSSGENQFYMSGSVYGTVVEALPDTGAETSFISPALASRLDLRPVPGTQKRITLANKKAVNSPGMVKVPWKFTKERNTHTINCWILPGCIHDLVLGNPFLRATHTLTKFRDRIKSKLLAASKQFSLNFLGNEKQRVRGYLNNHLTAALPDTGSDVMLIDGAYARRIGLAIDSDIRNRAKIRLADGSMAMTSGIVRDVDWRIGSTTVRCNFHVLENLDVDVILSNNYLFKMNIFSEQKKHFFNVCSKDHLFRFCLISLVKRENVVSPEAFTSTQQKWEELNELEKQEELYRRDKIREDISASPEEGQEAAYLAEIARQQHWEALRPEREAKWKVESYTAMGNVRNRVSRGSRWKKRISFGFSFLFSTKGSRR